MRVITYPELHVTKPMANHVLVKSVSKVNEIKLGSGIKLFIDNTAHPELHQSIINEVVATPRKLTYGADTVYYKKWTGFYHEDGNQMTETVKARRQIGNMPWQTKMELKYQDIVWVSSKAMSFADEQGHYLLCEGEKYYFIPYKDIYLKKDGDGIKMLNGYCLVEPITDKSETEQALEKMGLVYGTKKREIHDHYNDRFGIVRFMGEYVTDYYDGRDVGMDDPRVSVGDTVLMAWVENRRLSNGYAQSDSDSGNGDYHRLFDTTYIVSRPRNFLCVLHNSLF